MPTGAGGYAGRVSLTMSRGPLAAEPARTVNYRIDGPAARVHAEVFPRRVRAVLAERTVLDTLAGLLLHRTGELPELYVPQTDVQGHLVEPGATTRDLPGLGQARCSSVRVRDRVADDGLWSVPEPEPGAAWLRGYFGVAFAAFDAWYDEDEQVFGHLRDPYHRVDARATSRRVRVLAGGRVLAESDAAVLVSETGLPNRFYVPAEHVDAAALTRSDTRTHCPYKGTAVYADSAGLADVAWSYPEPLPEATPVAGHWSFDDTRVEIRHDSRVPAHHPERDPQPPSGIGAPRS